MDFLELEGDSDLNTYFIEQNKVVISDVDTRRAVVRHIRDKGAMNGYFYK